MAENETLGASFSIDVTNLKAGLSQANKMIRESESEFKAAAAGMDDWSKSQDGITAKINSLNTITDIQRKKIDALKSEYDRLVSEGLDPASQKAVDLRTKINNETAALNKNEAELKKQKSALEGLQNSSSDAAEEVDNLAESSKDAGKKVDDLGKNAKDSGSKLDGMKTVAKGVVGAVAAVAAACVAGIGSFLGLAESTRDTQVALAKLEQSFATAELSAEDASNTLNDLYGVLGDMDKSTEAANLLAKMSDSTEDLEKNTRILTGVFAEYGESIPTEGLAEAMQASSAMSSVQGVLADALEWQGVNLDEYNEKLASLATEEERAAYIQSTLTDLYGASADEYRKNNQALIEYNEATLANEKALADLGKVAMPIMTEIKNLATDLLVSIKPFVELIGQGLTGAFSGAADAGQKLADGLTGILNVAVEKLTAGLPIVLNVLTSMIPSVLTALLSALPEIVSAIVSVIQQITQALLESIPLLISCAVQIITTLLQSLGVLLPQIVQQIIAIIPDIIQSLIDSIPVLLTAATQFLLAIVQAIPVIVQQLLVELPKIIDTIITGLLDSLPVLLEASITLLMAIVEAIPQITDLLIDNLPMIIDTIISGLLTALPQLLDAAITLFFAILDAIPTLIAKMQERLPLIIATIVRSLVKAIPQLLSTAGQLLGQIIEAIGQLIVKLPSKCGEIITGIVSGLKKGISKIKGIGKDIVEGLWNGIKDMSGWISKKIKGFGEDVLGGIKDFFGINSPSKVMSDVVGKNLALGIGQGFENNIGSVNDEITSAMNFDDANSSNGSRTFRGGVAIYQTNNYSQAHSRYEIYKSKQQTAAAVRLALQKG